MFAPSLLASLRSLLNRLIPADDWPGAIESGVENYVLRHIERGNESDSATWRAAFLQLDAEARSRFGQDFSAATTAEQDELIGDLERGRAATEWSRAFPSATFIDRMIHLAHEGFYSDPGNGGNLHAVSWRMIRYDPRMPENEKPQR